MFAEEMTAQSRTPEVPLQLFEPSALVRADGMHDSVNRSTGVFGVEHKPKRPNPVRANSDLRTYAARLYAAVAT